MIKLKFVTGTVLILIFCCKGCPVWIVPFGRADMKGKKVIFFSKILIAHAQSRTSQYRNKIKKRRPSFLLSLKSLHRPSL